MNKTTNVTTSNKKQIQYQDQGNILAKLFVQSIEAGKEVLDLNKIMMYCLTPIPYCIGTADGYLAKGDKSKSFANISKDIENAENNKRNGIKLQKTAGEQKKTAENRRKP